MVYDEEHDCWIGAHYRGEYRCAQCHAQARLVKVWDWPVSGTRHYEVHCDSCGAHSYLKDVPREIRFVYRLL